MYDKEKKRKTQEMIDPDQWKGFTVRYFMALKDLMDLLDENESTPGDSGEAGQILVRGSSLHHELQRWTLNFVKNLLNSHL